MKKKIMIVWTVTECVKTLLNHNIGAYPVTLCWKHIMAALIYTDSMELPSSKPAGLQVASDSVNR
jgi:hypothetical protein